MFLRVSLLQITQQVDEQAEGPPLTLTAVSGQSISLTTDMLKVRGCPNNISLVGFIRHVMS
jgi:hypothetical protein